MNSRYIIRMLIWGLGFIVTLAFGVYGLVLNSRNPEIPQPDIPQSNIETNPPQEVQAGYFTEEELRTQINSINSGNLGISKNDLKLSIRGTDIPIITISESTGLSENSYNTILSSIAVILPNANNTNYFIENYPALTTGNKTFNGFKVEINPVLNENEAMLFSGETNIVRVTITKNQINL